MYRHCSLVLAFFGFFVVCFGAFCALYLFPMIYSTDHYIELAPGNPILLSWQNSSRLLSFKAYIFNITNPDEVLQGMKPEFKEVGPYLYSIMRFNHIESMNRTVIKYSEETVYYFDKLLSSCRNENDRLTVMNPLHVMLDELETKKMFTSHADNQWLITTTVKELLFEIKVKGKIVNNKKLPQLLEPLRNWKIESDGLTFSFFSNSSTIGPYEMTTGHEKTKKAEIVSFQGKSKLDNWPEPCGLLKGTAAYMIDPKPSTLLPALHLFVSPLCRSIFLDYQKPAITLTCKHEDHGDSVLSCPPQGVMDLQNCLGSGIHASFPRFYLADVSLWDSGVSPIGDEETYVDLDPLSGFFISTRKRFQFNIEVDPHIDETMYNATGAIAPILWFEEKYQVEFDTLLAYRGRNVVIYYYRVGQYCIIITGLGIMVLSTFFALSKEKPDKNVKKNLLPTHVPLDFDHNPNLYPQIVHKNVIDGLTKRNRQFYNYSMYENSNHNDFIYN